MRALAVLGGTFLLFCAVTTVLVVVASRRPSGFTGMDAAKIQQVRLEASAKAQRDAIAEK